MKSIPLFYFPITILAVDDEDIILDLLQEVLSTEFRLITTKNPHEALQIVNKSKSCFDITTFAVDHNEIDLYNDNSSITYFDFSKIINLATNPDRYNILGVLIADYSMPEMSGLELCKRLNSNSIKKILLTGKVDEQSVIEAFNWGLINQYVKKADSNTIALLRESIKEMLLQYFIEISENIKFISSKLEILSDTVFINFFQKIVNDNQIKEYYLIDKNGSFLLMDYSGKRLVLAVMASEDMEEFSQSYHDVPMIEKYVDQVKNKQSIPFFGIGIKSVNVPLEQWANCFFKANTLNCVNKTICWSLCPC
mgnify:CR=1 FL=1